MKVLFLIIYISATAFSHVYSQDLLGFETTSGNEKTDYKSDEPKALEAADYILSTAIDSKDVKRDQALMFMLMWMEGTPDYIFNIDEDIYLFTHSRDDILAVFMACMTRNCLENPVKAKNPAELKFMSVELFLDYCQNTSNQVKPYKQLEKLMKAREKGKLRNFISD